MNWYNVRLIFSREVRDQLRDRRTLFMIAVLPLFLYPFLGMTFVQISQFMREHATRVLVLGAPDPEGIPPLLANHHFDASLFENETSQRLLDVVSQEWKPAAGANQVDKPGQADHAKQSSGDKSPAGETLGDEEQRVLIADARRRMQEQDFDVVVYFPPDFASRLTCFRASLLSGSADADQAQVPPVEILLNKALEKSTIAYRRVAGVLERWREQIGRQNLKDSHIPAAAAKPFEFPEPLDVAQPGQQKAALWAKILPFVLFLWALTGAFYPAIDLCAGEKERGTLETLLSSPAERSEIVWGKLLTVMLFSIATAILNLASMGISGSLVLSQLPNLGPPPPITILWLLVALIPMAALFSALCLALAAFARSTKEGQYYLMPLVLVTMPLTILPMSPGVELNAGNSLIPITGMVLLLRTVLEGNYAEALPYVPMVVGVTLICCLLAIRWAADQFNTESVLFRESERWDFGSWFKHLRRDRDDTPSIGQAVLCGLLILLIRFFMGFALPMPNSFRDFAVLVMTTQLVVVLTPALMMTVMLTRSPRKTLLMFASPVMALPAAALLAITLHPVVHALTALVMKLYPMSDRLAEELGRLIGQTDNLWLKVAVIAVVPAICEELAFRGFILSGLRHMGHKWRAIAVSSLFFGISHLIFQQSLVACLLGAVIGYLAVQTGSILPGMVFHMLHNALGVLSSTALEGLDGRFAWLEWWISKNTDEEVTFHWPVVVLGLAASTLVFVWFRNLPYARTAEESLQEAIHQQSAHSAVG